jgi:hypothetical protein
MRWLAVAAIAAAACAALPRHSDVLSERDCAWSMDARGVHNANEWHFAVERVQCMLDAGAAVLLLLQPAWHEHAHMATFIDSVVLQQRAHVAPVCGAAGVDGEQCGAGSPVVVADGSAPANPFVRAGQVFWYSTAQATAWCEGRCGGHGSSPPAVLLTARRACTPGVDSAALPFCVAAVDAVDISAAASSAARVLQRAERALEAARLPPVPPRRACTDMRWYVYDDAVGSALGAPLSQRYASILAQLRAAPLATSDPGAACLFFPPFDTTPLSPCLRGSTADFGGNG